MKLNESLFEDRESYDTFFGTVELEFPESENVTTRDIEKMIKENISKHTKGNVVDVKFTTGEEVDFLKSKLREDWRNGEFTDEDFKDYENDIFNKFLALVLSIETVAKNHPEYKNKCAHLLKEIAYSANAHGDEIDGMDESLKESIEEVSNGAPEAGEDTGVASILNTLIKSEYDAIEEYNSAIATIASRDSDYSEIINVLTDIVGEEQVHVGQLTEVMKLVSPNVEKQEEGKQEAKEQINEPVESEVVEESLNEAKKASDPKKIERAKRACLDALENGSTASEEIIQSIKFIYGITREEAEKAFKEAHNIYASKHEDLNSTSTATDIVRELYNEFPKLDFIDERDMGNDKVALFFRFGKGLDLGKLEDYLKERNINYVIKNGKMRIIADEDEMNEDFVHYKPDGEHLNFNPIVLGSSLELGDEVYDSKTGHKLKVASEPVDFRWSRRITFLDLDTNEHKTQDVGINSMWTTVVEGDTTEEVDDDFDIEWHPASDLTESVDSKAFYQMIVDTNGNPSVQDFIRLGYTENDAIEKVLRMASNKADAKTFVEIAKKKLKEFDESLNKDKKEKETDGVYDWYKSRHPDDYQLDLIDKKVTFTDLAKKLKKGEDRKYYRLDSEDVGVGEYIDSAPLDDITSETIRRVELKESRKNIKEEKEFKRAKLMSHI